MDASERGRKRREMVAPREEPGGSIPPPARPRKERNPLDPEMLWDKETDDSVEDEDADEEGGDRDEWEESEDTAVEDLDDWDHPIRRLKIN